jgi:DNA polymerase-3 subunit delta'
MSDEIIARIEAPRRTERLVGHRAAAAVLEDAWTHGRLAHAWLISGPVGIGKATLAWRFAARVLARQDIAGGAPLDVPASDPAVHQVRVGSHPDIRLVRRDYAKTSPHRFMTEISVDNIREIGRFLRQTAALGGWRVVVVDAADDMNPNAQNALLKLLEEPPARTLFLVVCHAPARLPATVRSRCRTLALRPLDETEMTPLLVRLLPDLPADELAVLARLAEGSPGRALDLAEAGGVALFRDLIGLLDPLPELDAVRLHALADRFAPAAGEGAWRSFTGLLPWWIDRSIRAAALHGNNGEGDDDEIVPGEAALGRRLTQTGIAPWLEVRDTILRQAERADAVNLDRKQVTLNAFFGLAAAARQI